VLSFFGVLLASFLLECLVLFKIRRKKWHQVVQVTLLEEEVELEQRLFLPRLIVFQLVGKQEI